MENITDENVRLRSRIDSIRSEKVKSKSINEKQERRKRYPEFDGTNDDDAGYRKTWGGKSGPPADVQRLRASTSTPNNEVMSAMKHVIRSILEDKKEKVTRLSCYRVLRKYALSQVELRRVKRELRLANQLNGSNLDKGSLPTTIHLPKVNEETPSFGAADDAVVEKADDNMLTTDQLTKLLNDLEEISSRQQKIFKESLDSKEEELKTQQVALEERTLEVTDLTRQVRQLEEQVSLYEEEIQELHSKMTAEENARDEQWDQYNVEEALEEKDARIIELETQVAALTATAGGVVMANRMDSRSHGDSDDHLALTDSIAVFNRKISPDADESLGDSRSHRKYQQPRSHLKRPAKYDSQNRYDADMSDSSFLTEQTTTTSAQQSLATPNQKKKGPSTNREGEDFQLEMSPESVQKSPIKQVPKMESAMKQAAQKSYCSNGVFELEMSLESIHNSPKPAAAKQSALKTSARSTPENAKPESPVKQDAQKSYHSNGVFELEMSLESIHHSPQSLESIHKSPKTPIKSALRSKSSLKKPDSDKVTDDFELELSLESIQKSPTSNGKNASTAPQSNENEKEDFSLHISDESIQKSPVINRKPWKEDNNKPQSLQERLNQSKIISKMNDREYNRELDRTDISIGTILHERAQSITEDSESDDESEPKSSHHLSKNSLGNSVKSILKSPRQAPRSSGPIDIDNVSYASDESNDETKRVVPLKAPAQLPVKVPLDREDEESIDFLSAEKSSSMHTDEESVELSQQSNKQEVESKSRTPSALEYSTDTVFKGLVSQTAASKDDMSFRSADLQSIGLESRDENPVAIAHSERHEQSDHQTSDEKQLTLRRVTENQELLSQSLVTIVALKKEVSDLTERLRVSEEELKGKKELEEKYEEATRELKKSEKKVKKIENQLAESEQKLDNAQQKISMLEDFVVQDMAPPPDIMNECANSAQLRRSKISTDSSQFSESLGSDPRVASVSLQEVQHENAMMQGEISELQRKLASAQSMVNELEKEKDRDVAKLSDVHTAASIRAEKDAKMLQEKSRELAELSAAQEKLKMELQQSNARAKTLEQDRDLQRQLVVELSQSWDQAASHDVNMEKLRRERDESMAKTAELSLQLAECQMTIDALQKDLRSERDARDLDRSQDSQRGRISMPSLNGIRRSLSSDELDSSTPGRRGGRRFRNTPPRTASSSSDQSDDQDAIIRKLSGKLSDLENQNAAYEATVHALRRQIERLEG